MTLRIAVIGTGVMGADHARIVAEDLPGASLQLVCDIDAARARRVAEAAGAADIETDPDAAILRPDVDAVIVASPDATHAHLARACIAAGKPVLCEKPLAPTAADCLQVVLAEAAAGRQWLQLGFMRRFDQSYIEMKAALADGKIGRPIMMHNFHRNAETPAARFTADMAITNSAPHEFDVARWVLGTEYAAITAFAPERRLAGVGPVFMVLQTRDAQLVTIEINNNAAYGYDVRGELVGETGAVAMRAPVHSHLDSGFHSQTDYAADWRPRYAEAYRRQNKTFVNFATTGRFPLDAATAWDGYCAAAIAEAGVKALRTGSSVALALEAMPALYGTPVRD